MAEWYEIKENFIKWLKTQKDVDFNENDKEFAPIKYSKQFKLFIEKHDGDENLNMDNFVKRNTQKMETDNDKANQLEKEQAALKKDEREEGYLIDDMLKDYIADLDKDDKVFQAIDGILGGEKDGEISNAERNMFIQQATLDAADNNDTNFSFYDLVESVTKIQNDDNAFLNRVAQQQPAAPAVADDNGDVPALQDKPAAELTDTEKVEELSKITTSYEPKTIENKDLKIKQPNTPTIDTVKFEKGSNLNDLKNDTLAGIEAGKADLSEFVSAYENSTTTITAAKDYIDANQQQYDAVMTQLMEQNTHLKETNQQITTFENTIDDTNSALNAQYSAKDGLETAIVAIDGEISALPGQLQTAPTNATGDEKAAVEQHNSAIRIRIAELKAQKEELAQQLLELNDEILKNKELLDETSQNLDLAYENMNIALQNIQFSDENSKEIVFSTLENKRVLALAKNEQSSAHAGMVAMDSYISALEVKLENIEEAIAEAKKEESKEASTTPEETPEETLEETSQINLPTGIAGLSTFASANDTETDGTYNCKINGQDATVKIVKQGENSYTYTIEINGQTKTLTLDNNTLSLGIGDNADYYKNDGEKTTVNSDGKQIISKENDTGYELDVRFEQEHFTTTLSENGLTISDNENHQMIKATETQTNTGTVNNLVTSKNGKTISSYTRSSNDPSRHSADSINYSFFNEDGKESSFSFTQTKYEGGTKYLQSTQDFNGNTEIVEQYENTNQKVTKRVTTSTTVNEDGSKTTTTTTLDFKYNENNELIEYTETVEKNGEKESVKRYDAQGNLLEEIETQ